MNIDGNPWRTIWLERDGSSVGVIDQTKLPHVFTTISLSTCKEAADAISSMVVRGAPLIGVTGAYGLMLALQEDPSQSALERAYRLLISTRPTAINLRWALDRVSLRVGAVKESERVAVAREEASLIAMEDVAMCESIASYGFDIFKKLIKERPAGQELEPLNVLTHCNAGWLAAVDWGTALAPIYKAHRSDMQLHVWVDETRPRNQGASLTTFELSREGVPHTLVVDNAGGHLMQHGKVDAVIVGADRVTKSGDVCNKIGTYLKALAARDNGVPFYVAVPSSTIDWSIADGLSEIPIESRSEREVNEIQGALISSNSNVCRSELVGVQLSPFETRAHNPAFDVTPAELVTGLITERGLALANYESLKRLFPEEN